jgi:uncharacterized protein
MHIVIERLNNVNQQIEYLIKLQETDSKILSMTRAVNEFPARIMAAELPLKESQIALDTAKQKIDVFEKKKRDKESGLEDVNVRIQKMKGRTPEIKTNKEYQALLKEIEAVEKERSAIEDEILVIMEEIDACSKQKKAAETTFIIEKKKIEDVKKKIDNDRSEIEKELSSVKEQRASVSAFIDRELYDQYIILFEACNGVAVTEVKEEICQGCNMNIPPQLFVEIKKQEEMFNCPQCRRLLYYKNNAQTSA